MLTHISQPLRTHDPWPCGLSDQALRGDSAAHPQHCKFHFGFHLCTGTPRHSPTNPPSKSKIPNICRSVRPYFLKMLKVEKSVQMYSCHLSLLKLEWMAQKKKTCSTLEEQHGNQDEFFVNVTKSQHFPLMHKV